MYRASYAKNLTIVIIKCIAIGGKCLFIYIGVSGQLVSQSNITFVTYGLEVLLYIWIN
jgi:hypothetical protein